MQNFALQIDFLFRLLHNIKQHSQIFITEITVKGKYVTLTYVLYYRFTMQKVL